MATLYLHIGTHKTGTTAIQNFCAKNVVALAKQGYCYPRLPFKEVNYDRNGNFMGRLHQRADGSFEAEEEREIWRRCMDCVVRKFRHYHSVILSDESIWADPDSIHPGLFRNLKAEADGNGFDVKFIMYVRRQDQFVNSYWKQMVKNTRDLVGMIRPDELLKRVDDLMPLDYYAQIEQIARYFGRESIIVRVYDRDRFAGGDVLSDFLQVIGISWDEDFKKLGNRNPSLQGNMVEIKRIINTIPNMDVAVKRRAGYVAVACSTQEEPFSLFTDDEARQFLARYEESNRSLARDYLGMGEVSPFPEPEPQLPKWDPNNPEMYESIVRFFARAVFMQRPDSRLKSACHTIHRWLGRMRRAMCLWRIERGPRRGGGRDNLSAGGK